MASTNLFHDAEGDDVRLVASHSIPDTHSAVLCGERDRVTKQNLNVLIGRRCTPCRNWNGLAIFICRSWDAIVCATLAHASS